MRLEEVHQSIRIIEQAFKQLPGGPVCLDDPRIILPPKDAVYNSIGPDSGWAEKTPRE